MRNITLVGLACYTLLALTTTSIAQQPYPTPQERPDLFTTVQDSILVPLLDGGGMTDPNMVSGAYTFTMLYDSSCRIQYLFAEPWHNGHRLTLDRWFNERSVNAHQDLLSFNSRTKGFRVYAGDTVSFFREFDWVHPVLGQQSPTNFLSRDTLAYAVELVDVATMSRLALIDSLSVLPHTPPQQFRFFAHRNAMAIARYAIPFGMNGDSVYMRVRVYARGPGEYYFTRLDHIVIDYSKGAMRHPVLLADQELLRQCCWTPIPIPEPEQFGKSIIDWIAGDTSLLSVHQSTVGSADVKIQVAPAPELGELSIIIFDSQGNALWSPFSGIIRRPQVLEYRFESSGAYVISLVRDGAIFESRKVTITK